MPSLAWSSAAGSAGSLTIQASLLWAQDLTLMHGAPGQAALLLWASASSSVKGGIMTAPIHGKGSSTCKGPEVEYPSINQPPNLSRTFSDRGWKGHPGTCHPDIEGDPENSLLLWGRERDHWAEIETTN